MNDEMTIFTEQYGQDNYDSILQLANVGNLAPITLTSADGQRNYLSARACAWDENTTYKADETQAPDDIIAGLVTAFADLQAGNIEAITMSIPVFLMMQQRPEFQPQ